MRCLKVFNIFFFSLFLAQPLQAAKLNCKRPIHTAKRAFEHNIRQITSRENSRGWKKLQENLKIAESERLLGNPFDMSENMDPAMFTVVLPGDGPTSEHGVLSMLRGAKVERSGNDTVDTRVIEEGSFSQIPLFQRNESSDADAGGGKHLIIKEGAPVRIAFPFKKISFYTPEGESRRRGEFKNPAYIFFEGRFVHQSYKHFYMDIGEGGRREIVAIPKKMTPHPMLDEEFYVFLQDPEINIIERH